MALNVITTRPIFIQDEENQREERSSLMMLIVHCHGNTLRRQGRNSKLNGNEKSGSKLAAKVFLIEMTQQHCRSAAGAIAPTFEF